MRVNLDHIGQRLVDAIREDMPTIVTRGDWLRGELASRVKSVQEMISARNGTAETCRDLGERIIRATVRPSATHGLADHQRPGATMGDGPLVAESVKRWRRELADGIVALARETATTCSAMDEVREPLIDAATEAHKDYFGRYLCESEKATTRLVKAGLPEALAAEVSDACAGVVDAAGPLGNDLRGPVPPQMQVPELVAAIMPRLASGYMRLLSMPSPGAVSKLAKVATEVLEIADDVNN